MGHVCVCVCGRCARNCPAVPYIAAETRSKKPSSPCTRNTLTKPRETTFASFEPRILHHPVPVGLSPYFATVRHVRKCARLLSSTRKEFEQGHCVRKHPLSLRSVHRKQNDYILKSKILLNCISINIKSIWECSNQLDLNRNQIVNSRNEGMEIWRHMRNLF